MCLIGSAIIVLNKITGSQDQQSCVSNLHGNSYKLTSYFADFAKISLQVFVL
jgi:hypothetical protein